MASQTHCQCVNRSDRFCLKRISRPRVLLFVIRRVDESKAWSLAWRGESGSDWLLCLQGNLIFLPGFLQLPQRWILASGVKRMYSCLRGSSQKKFCARNISSLLSVLDFRKFTFSKIKNTWLQSRCILSSLPGK